MKVTVNGFWGGFPAANGATSSYLISSKGFNLLVDCGSGALSKLQTHTDVMDLDAVILSHYHFDHIADIGVLQYAVKVQNIVRETNKILPIYGHKEDMAGFRSLGHEDTEARAYDPEQGLQVGPFIIQFLKTIHPAPCYAMRISDGDATVVYTADTSYREEYISFSEDADLLITDSNFYDGMDGSGPGHMTSTESAHIATSAHVKQLWLSHLPHFGNHDQLKMEAERIFAGKVTLAHEGLSWEA
ncbi:MBL fold metallo-hydrolase [Pontibacillus litoralis]|uniref:Metallo-beta-lactamase domain-containing protein n=1 Tax=Pontibacillus litoralis JSM 072002 TaxID=1385512 RepID=A0A0A5FYB9_9BACI|nr:MBL fold metallo-hydrolase [Pontibacillus litoralis]KGX84789.1 hypothetical protein N784_11905 [Pontibacillus litoralis JSM 072002]